MGHWDDYQQYAADIAQLNADKAAKQAEIDTLNSDIAAIDAQITNTQALCDQALSDHNDEVQALLNS